jgi:hypothetical protein
MDTGFRRYVRNIRGTACGEWGRAAVRTSEELHYAIDTSGYSTSANQSTLTAES